MLKLVLEAYYKDDVEYLDLITSESANGILCGIIKQRKERNLELKYKSAIYMEEPRYHDAIIEGEDVRLQYTVSVQEATCLIDSTRQIKEGNDSRVENANYLVELMLNPEPKEELLGHPWVFTKVVRTSVIEMLF